MDILYKENDNLNQEAIDEYRKLSPEELDRMLDERIKEIKKHKK